MATKEFEPERPESERRVSAVDRRKSVDVLRWFRIAGGTRTFAKRGASRELLDDTGPLLPLRVTAARTGTAASMAAVRQADLPTLSTSSSSGRSRSSSVIGSAYGRSMSFRPVAQKTS